MNRESLKVLEEFGDDIEKVCDEVIELRDTITDLKTELSDHVCNQ